VVETLVVLQCVALAALILAALAAARWFWKSAPCYRKRGLADVQPKGKPEPEDESSCYVVVRPGQHRKPKEEKRWLRP